MRRRLSEASAGKVTYPVAQACEVIPPRSLHRLQEVRQGLPVRVDNSDKERQVASGQMTSRLSKRASQMLNKPPARSMAAIANVPINVPYIEDADTGTYRM